MKRFIENLTGFIDYHWNISPTQMSDEGRDWQHRVISIDPASKYSDLKKFQFDKNLLFKTKHFFHKVSLALWHAWSVKPSNKLSFFESSLIADKHTPSFYKGICDFPKNFQPTFLITDPNIITAILMHERNEIGDTALFDGGISVKIARKILGNNILTCPENEHKVLQKFSTIHFVPQAVKSYFSPFLQSSRKLLNKWEEQGIGTDVNISQDLTIFSARAVAENLLGFQGSITELCEAMHALLEENQRRFKTRRHKMRYKKALEFIRSSAEMACQGEQRNFLKCMKETKDQNGQLKFHMDEVVSMAEMLFFAGQDATSSLLAYLLYTLGLPQFTFWQEKLYHEFKVSDGDLLNFIHASKTLENIFKEGLRAFPSSFAQTRETVQDMIIDGCFFIPKGSLLYLVHYFSQRDARRWGFESQKFDPSRFEDPSLNAKEHGPFQYFSLGPTICLGRHFVTLLIKIFLVEMIRTFQWQTCLPLPNIEADVVLDLKPFVKIKLTKRESMDSPDFFHTG